MGEYHYMLYGAHLCSNYPFSYNFLPPENPASEVDIHFSVQPVAGGYLPEGERMPVEDYEDGHVELYLADSLFTFLIQGVAAFEIQGNRITVFPFVSGLEYLLELFFTGNLMSFMRERQGLLMLHASAIKAGDGCVAFIADSGTGKTTLATACIAAGCPLVTDDILALSVDSGGVTALPGFPQMKLFPHQLALLGGNPADYSKIHPRFEKLKVPIGPWKGGEIGSFHNTALPLKALYLLQRSDTEVISVSPIGAAAGVISLVRHAFAAELMDVVDRGAERLGKLGRVASLTPLKRLMVPDGYNRLPEVVDFLASGSNMEQEIR